MQGRDEPGKHSQSLISFVIVSILGLQLYGSFCSRHIAERFPAMRKVRASNLWPFVDYPMFSPSHFPGELIDRRALIGVLDNFTEVRIDPADLGINGQHFNVFLSSMLREDPTRTEEFVQLWESRHHHRLIRLRFENHPLRFTGTGLEERPGEILMTVDLAAAEAAQP